MDKNQLVINGLHISAMDIESGGEHLNLPDNLWQLLRKNTVVANFLLWSGCVWLNECDKLQKLWQGHFIFCRCCLLLGAAGFSYYMVTQTHVLNQVLSLSAVLMCLSPIPGQYYNQFRLLEPSGKFEVDAVPESVQIVIHFAAVSMFAILFLLVGCVLLGTHLNNNEIPLLILLVLAEYYVVTYMIFNLLLLLIDANVAALAIDHLALRVKDQTIDMTSLAAVRDDVRNRSEDSKWVTGIVIVPCVMSLIAIIVAVFKLDSSKQSQLPWYEVVYLTSLIFTLLRDALFVGIAFWYVARANGKADELTVQLSRSIWCPGPDCVPDMGRLSVYASCAAEPITFKLLLRRISWADVTVNALSASVALLVGLIKYLAGM